MDAFDTFKDENHRDGKLFRRRFRVPFKFLHEVIDMVKRENWVDSAESDCFGRPRAPVELLVLAVFRVLGRRWTFDDCYEATFISAEVHRKFFHLFVKRYATDIYPTVCKPPETEQNVIMLDVHGNEVLHKGLCLLCDNGYHKWKFMQCPIKLPLDTSDIEFTKYSEMLESLRKDVVC